MQADLAEQEELTRVAEEEEDRRQAENEHLKDEEKKEQEKKKPKIGDFDKGWMVSDHVIPQPSQFAIGKLKSFNFVELWYFTDEGCHEAQDSSKAQSDDAYGLMRLTTSSRSNWSHPSKPHGTLFKMPTSLGGR